MIRARREPGVGRKWLDRFPESSATLGYPLPMDSFTLQVTAHRIGGVERAERSWGPKAETMHQHPGTWYSMHLDGRSFPADSIRVDFRGWTLARPGLLSTEMAVLSWDGCPIGPPRPVLLSLLPSDVPLYSTHIATDADRGVYSVGLIVPRSAWTPKDLELAAEAVA